jgi:putative DNA-invertase from lambdoid prophage Rac
MIHGYVRTSTDKQVESPETQREQILTYCRRNKLVGEDEVPMWYVDAAISSEKPLVKREAGSVMTSNLRRGDHIVFTKIDRAFRRFSECAVAIDNWKNAGVNVHITNLFGQAVDMQSEWGMLMIRILAAVAEYDRAMIRERTRDVLRSKKARGEMVGNVPLGYKVRPEKERGRIIKRLVPDHDERALMRMILKMRVEDGRSWLWIAEELKTKQIPSRGSVFWNPSKCFKYAQREQVLQASELMSGAKCNEPSH